MTNVAHRTLYFWIHFLIINQLCDTDLNVEKYLSFFIQERNAEKKVAWKKCQRSPDQHYVNMIKSTEEIHFHYTILVLFSNNLLNIFYLPWLRTLTALIISFNNDEPYVTDLMVKMISVNNDEPYVTDLMAKMLNSPSNTTNTSNTRIIQWCSRIE